MVAAEQGWTEAEAAGRQGNGDQGRKHTQCRQEEILGKSTVENLSQVRRSQREFTKLRVGWGGNMYGAGGTVNGTAETRSKWIVETRCVVETRAT